MIKKLKSPLCLNPIVCTVIHVIHNTMIQHVTFAVNYHITSDAIKIPPQQLTFPLGNVCEWEPDKSPEM